MFSHVMVGTNNLDRARRFYDALFSSMGNEPGRVDRKGRLVYARDGARFMVTKPINGQPACGANGGTIGFLLASDEQVHAWYEAGSTAGGVAIEDPPGYRATSVGDVCLAYLRDPDGNKLCGLHSPNGAFK